MISPSRKKTDDLAGVCWIALITFITIQSWIASQDKIGRMVAVSDHMVAMSDHIYGIQVCISKKKELENK